MEQRSFAQCSVCLLPVALAIGSGTQIIQDMAIAIMGGLFFAIVVNLFVVPLFFYWLYIPKFKSEM